MGKLGLRALDVSFSPSRIAAFPSVEQPGYTKYG